MRVHELGELREQRGKDGADCGEPFCDTASTSKSQWSEHRDLRREIRKKSSEIAIGKAVVSNNSIGVG